MLDAAGKHPAYAVAVIINARNEVLLLRRAVTATMGPGKWGLPGGRLLSGEAPEAGMARELKEELGDAIKVKLEARLGPVALIGATPSGSVHLFRFRILEGAIRLNAEHTHFAWVDRYHFPSLDVMTGVAEDLGYFGIWSDG